jgi:dihydroorotate dehydrogenase
MFDPEDIHDLFIRIGVIIGATAVGRWLTHIFFDYKDEKLEQDILGIHFSNPIGLAAGFDKNAQLTKTLPSVGFGWMEIGSITGKACAGNPRPRLWRLPKSNGLAVYYGLKNDGCDAISQRLKAQIGSRAPSADHVQKGYFSIPVGVSVAMTNNRENADIDIAIDDYEHAFRQMEPIGDYVTVNISCPNAVAGQTFTIPANLERLLQRLDTIHTDKPVFVKMSPDFNDNDLDATLNILDKHRIHGIIATNLAKKRANQKISEGDIIPDNGGMSGKILESASDRTLSHIYKKTGKRFILVGCGGVFSAEDAYHKIRLGASLIQLVTGMIFQGPQSIGDINRGLSKLLARDGFTDISQAVGADIC